MVAYFDDGIDDIDFEQGNVYARHNSYYNKTAAKLCWSSGLWNCELVVVNVLLLLAVVFQLELVLSIKCLIDL